MPKERGAKATRAAILITMLAVLAACGWTGENGGGGTGRLKLATRVAPITSITAAVAGDHADVEGIVPEGTSECSSPARRCASRGSYSSTSQRRAST